MAQETAKISILCYPDQIEGVYKTLFSNELHLFGGAPYVISSSIDSYTLDDQRATDKWSIHPMLRTRAAEGVPHFAPFALIVTAGVVKPTFAGHTPEDVHLKRDKENPCPPYTERTKNGFAINLSKHWQADLEAPICNEFPYHYAIANFIWWNMEEGALLVTMGEKALLPLVGCYMGMSVLALDKSDDHSAEDLQGALNSMKYMHADLQRRCAIHTQSNVVHFIHPVF